MRNQVLATVWLASLAIGGSAFAQNPQPFEDHLLSEEEYLNTPAPPQYPPPQYAPPQYGQPQYGQPQYGQPVDPNAPYGAGQPYDGQPSYAYDQPAGQPDDPSYEEDDGYDVDAYQDFEGALSPYGSWVDVAGYGQVWTPSSGIVGADFSPYSTGGHWVLTEYGWTWVSDWDWGWAPFHYGRWMSLVGYGWCWRPGRSWGPGWVSWRGGGGYVGWAPLPPRGVRIAPPATVHGPWRFTTAGEFGSAHPRYVAPQMAAAVYNHTSTISNFRSVAGAARFNSGPGSSLIGRTVTPIGVGGLRSAAPHAAIAPRGPNLNRVGAPIRMPSTIGGPRVSAPAVRPQPSYRSDLVGPVPPGYRAPSVVARPSYTNSYGNGYNGYAPGYGGQHYAAQPSYAAPRYAPSYAAPRYNAPSYHTVPSYHYTAPSYHYGTPSYSAPSYHYSQPSYHSAAPSYSAPHYSAPSRPTYSAPAFHGGGGGGAHFGGGGGHFGGGGHR